MPTLPLFPFFLLSIGSLTIGRGVQQVSCVNEHDKSIRAGRASNCHASTIYLPLSTFHLPSSTFHLSPSTLHLPSSHPRACHTLASQIQSFTYPNATSPRGWDMSISRDNTILWFSLFPSPFPPLITLTQKHSANILQLQKVGSWYRSYSWSLFSPLTLSPERRLDKALLDGSYVGTAGQLAGWFGFGIAESGAWSD